MHGLSESINGSAAVKCSAALSSVEALRGPFGLQPGRLLRAGHQPRFLLEHAPLCGVVMLERLEG